VESKEEKNKCKVLLLV